MPQIVSDIFRKDLLERTIDFKTDVIMIALMTKEHQYKASDSYWSNVRHNEIKGKGYEAGGQPLHGVRFRKGAYHVYLMGDNMVWDKARFTMRSLVLYFKLSGRIIGTTGFDFDYIAGGGAFTTEWDKRGIVSEYLPDMPPEYLNYYFNKENGND